jgi:hypothetical protein
MCQDGRETKREEAVPGILIKNCHSSVEVVPRRRGSRGYFWHQGSPCASGLNCLGDARFVVRTKWFQACGVARIASGEKLCGLGVPAQYVPRAALRGPIHLSRAPISTFPTPIFVFPPSNASGRSVQKDEARGRIARTRGACTYMHCIAWSVVDGIIRKREVHAHMHCPVPKENAYKLQ